MKKTLLLTTLATILFGAATTNAIAAGDSVGNFSWVGTVPMADSGDWTFHNLNGDNDFANSPMEFEKAVSGNSDLYDVLVAQQHIFDVVSSTDNTVHPATSYNLVLNSLTYSGEDGIATDGTGLFVVSLDNAPMTLNDEVGGLSGDEHQINISGTDIPAQMGDRMEVNAQLLIKDVL
ncbi:hypothetical protein [Shewanella atlantica]|uniref:Uncharacterized protein n=1 Tax=Shewanella atlantica TaxID=271099 RepID=A0A3S0JRZ4_9GAMM|nr:hypothetical protein [Shewanella atlantica]RTR27711.1 hypothetical protein EKG39_20130 [Shewanella atlantica]